MATTEFGLALRGWRDKVTPEAAGLPAGGHRRAVGLRREELAQLAGISVDYITRLEQGRAVNPSEQVIEALARALRLSCAERVRLFNLAGRVPPGQGTVPAYIPPGVQRMLDRLRETPVAVFDAAMTQLMASPLYVALMGEHVGKERNACGATSSAPVAECGTPPSHCSSCRRPRSLRCARRLSATPPTRPCDV